MSLGLFKWLSSLVERLYGKKGGEKRRKERRWERNRKGTEGMKQENSFPVPPPLTIALSSPSKEQMPRFSVASLQRMSGEK